MVISKQTNTNVRFFYLSRQPWRRPTNDFISSIAKHVWHFCIYKKYYSLYRPRVLRHLNIKIVHKTDL
jgi:hypothetical protein